MAKRRRMPWLGWVVVLLALVEGGWLVFDGAHGLLTGDYVTPSSGARAGQLGPWSELFLALGIDPRSTLVMSIHVGLGGTWLLALAAFVKRVPGSRLGLIVCAVLGLWYLPWGTLLSAIQLVLLTRRSLREPGK